ERTRGARFRDLDEISQFAHTLSDRDRNAGYARSGACGMTIREVLEALPGREGVPDKRWFVGRWDELEMLRGLFLGKQSSSLWLHGPRRIGKTSLADRVADL